MTDPTPPDASGVLGEDYAAVETIRGVLIDRGYTVTGGDCVEVWHALQLVVGHITARARIDGKAQGWDEGYAAGAAMSRYSEDAAAEFGIPSWAVNSYRTGSES